MNPVHASSFMTFTPVMQARPLLVAAASLLGQAESGSASRAFLAKVQLHILDGNIAYQRGSYAGAIGEYKAARALLYSQVRSDFDDALFGASSSVFLPGSLALEASMIQLGSNMLEAVALANATKTAPATWRVLAEPAPDLVRFSSRGFNSIVENRDMPGNATPRDQSRGAAASWNVAIDTADGLATLDVAQGKAPGSNILKAKVYDGRANAVNIADLVVTIVEPASASSYINHLYSFVLPLKLGDALHAIGRYADAEKSFRQAADYNHINRTHEATAVWIKMATNIGDWGDSLYKLRKVEAAKAQYAKIVTEDFQPSAAYLYTMPALQVPAGMAKNAIRALTSPDPGGANAELAHCVLIAAARMRSLLEGLDFFGVPLSPIHSFEYLQSIAKGFAQSAIQAEREFVNFMTQQESESATRRDLETMVAMAQGEVDTKEATVEAAQDEVDAAHIAVDQATQRLDSAKRQRDDYAKSSASQIWAQAAAQALAGGEDATHDEIVRYADQMDRGKFVDGPGPILAAAETYRTGRRTRTYELSKMDANIEDLEQSINLANDVLLGAIARLEVAKIALQASKERAALANEAIDAFDDEMFTPEVWAKMATVMRSISQSYLDRAITIAKLMERAFNFENDTSIGFIKSGYGHAMPSPGSGGSLTLLGGDSLARDIDSFTMQAITHRTRKNSHIKDIISVARNFPAHFEAFRRTGVLEMETDLYEFDRLHPGFHNQRIEAVEVEFAGLIPPEGLNGLIRCGGVTGYRTRSRGANKRIHQVDTMAMSNFTMRNDLFAFTPEPGLRGMFQGMGLATTWKLHLPRRSNDFDYARIFDINLVLYYSAQFDPLLRTAILSSPVRAGELSELKNYDLRFDFPENWYALYRIGRATFAFARDRLPFNQKDFQVDAISWRIVTKTGISPEGIKIAITGPGGAKGTATTDADGVVSTGDANLKSLAAGSPLGDWQIEIESGRSLEVDGNPLFDRIYNIQVGLEYSFAYLGEEV